MGYLTEFDGKSFQDVARGDLDLSSIIGDDDNADKDSKSKAKRQIKRLMTSCLSV